MSGGPPRLRDFELNQFQVDATKAVYREQFPIGIRGAVGCGKTAWIAFLCFLIAMTRPGARLLVIMLTYKSLNAVFRPVFDEVLGGDARWSERHMRYSFENGSEVQLAYYAMAKTANESTNPIEGQTRHLVIVDEVQMISPMVLKHATQRARQAVADTSGRICRAGVVLIGRPSAIEWHPGAVKAAGGVMLSATTYMNAANLSPGYIEAMRATMSDAEFKAIVECAPMPTEGAYFTDWKEAPWPAGNVMNDFVYDPNKTTVVTTDLGFGWPAAILIQTVTRRLPTGELVEVDVMFDDVAPDNVTTSELARAVTDRAWPAERHGAPPPGVPYLLNRAVTDPAGYQRNAQTGRTDINVLQGPPRQPKGLSGLGVAVRAPTDPTRRDLLERCQRIRAMVKAADGVRRLCISAGLQRREARGRSIRAAMVQYSWDHLRAARAGSKTRTPGQPDHHIDALGYYVAVYRWTLTPPRRTIRAADMF